MRSNMGGFDFRGYCRAPLIFLFLLPSLFQSAFAIAGYIDADQLAINEKRQRVAQDENNLIVQQVALSEFELKAQRISRQLEALSFMAADVSSSRRQEFAADLSRELKGLESHIEKTKECLKRDRLLLEEVKRQLAVREQEYMRQLEPSDGRVHGAKNDGYGERINRENERLRMEALQRQKETDLQNLRLKEKGNDSPFLNKQTPEIQTLTGGSNYDAQELGLCDMLEKKVSEKDYDIGEINLLVAKGLPGAEDIDVAKTLSMFDLWAAWVKRETERNFNKFHKAPEEYHNSEAYFRILLMVCVLQEDFKICYNKDPKMRAGPVELIPSDFTFFGNPRDLFVNGLAEATHQGTCASLPVLYVAIGRRLGYPLKLVECKGHLFVRWEDARERFNIEGTNRGLNCYPDKEYMEWPWPISKEEMATGMYMKSLSPRRELAAFLELRALCLKQHGYEMRQVTVKRYADKLRKKEGVDLDRLSQLLGRCSETNFGGDAVVSPPLYQVLTNTNTWRKLGHERGSHEKHTVYSVERVDVK